MEFIIVFFIIFVFVFLNSLTYILGALATPVESVFLGTVHWTGDYFSYLSQFAQGISSWFFSYDLYTSDFPHPTLVGWVNVFLGRIFHLIGINHLMAYQLSIVIFAATFLGVSYLLIREIFKGDREEKGKRLVAFILFVTSNALPKIIWEGGKWSLSYYDFWFNNGLPFNRLGGVPHHLIARTAIPLALLLAIWWWKKKDWRILLSLPIVGFVLASVEPVHWGLVVLVLFIFGIIKSEIRNPKHETNSNPQNFSTPHSVRRSKNKILLFELVENYFCHLNLNIVSDFDIRISNFFPSFFFFISGLPMAIYLKNIVSHQPYSQLAVWEATQQLHINFLDFISGNGLVAILAMFGIILFIRNFAEVGKNFSAHLPNSPQPLHGFGSNTVGVLEKLASPQNFFRRLCQTMGFAKLTALVFTLLTISLYFSPLPEMLKIVNVRFLPANTTIFLAVFAAEFVFFVAARFKKREKWVVIFVIFITVIITIPATVKQLQIRTTVDPNNAFFYVSKDVIAAYQEARELSTIKDTFLIIWPFNWSFPGIVGRRVYEGHILATIDYYRKEKQTRDFFFGEMKSADMQKFLTSEKIDYVLTYPWTRNINDIPILEKIYENKTLGIYKVIK